jgi:O-acetyl-ADP-ribose deacetylase (regulator of RNase III)
MTEIQIGEVIIRAHQGDITDLHVDAIVNAANSDLWMGSGVAGAIKMKGGYKIEEEAMALGPISPGQAVITSGGFLDAKYVIHCAGMPPGGDAKIEFVSLSVEMGLNLAKMKKLKTVAIPAIGAGVGGLSYHDSWSAILESLSKVVIKAESLESILLVTHGLEAFEELTQFMKGFSLD